MTRSVFAKIFLWFWFAIAAVIFAMAVLTMMGGLQRLNHRWLARSLDLYAQRAVESYMTGGRSGLQQYLDELEAESAMRAALLGPSGKDLLGRGLPANSAGVLAAAQRARKTQFRTGPVWVGASVIHTQAGDYILVARIYPLRGFWDPSRWGTLVLRLAIALVLAGVLCWLIARHITAPIRILQWAARRIAEGDLSARATPAIPPRNDELAELAGDFDQMAERIQSLLRKQQELLGDISHELRSPLTRLSVSLELARRGDSEAMDRMEVDLERLGALIRQVLTLTRLQLQESSTLNETVDLRAIVESVAEDASYEGQNSNRSVLITRADECIINGDASLLRSCIENVVRNGIRYTEPDSAVEVSLVCAGSPPRASITVADRGPGVPSELLSRLFEPFYRVSEARDRASGGAGLGLSIAQKVTALHRGSVHAENRTGGGLVVSIQLPAGEHSVRGLLSSSQPSH